MDNIDGVKVIAASGKQGAGKSSLVNSLKERSKGIFDFVTVLKFADPIYELHNTINNKTKRFIEAGDSGPDAVLSFAKDLTEYCLNKMEVWTLYRPKQESEAVTNLIDYFFTWIHKKFETGVADKEGPLLQYLGTEFGRKTYGDNVWVDLLLRRIKKFDFGGWEKGSKLAPASSRVGVGVVFVDDCRFENEFNALAGAVRVRLECSEETRKQRAESWRSDTSHPSEIGLDGYALSGFFDRYFNTDVGGKPSEVIAEEILLMLKAKQ